MRTAIDDILAQNLGEGKCIQIAQEIEQLVREHKYIRNDMSRKEWLQVFYALQLFRESIADSLDIPYD